jgi:hypothetical protein
MVRGDGFYDHIAGSLESSIKIGTLNGTDYSAQMAMQILKNEQWSKRKTHWHNDNSLAFRKCISENRETPDENILKCVPLNSSSDGPHGRPAYLISNPRDSEHQNEVDRMPGYVPMNADAP